MLTWKIRRLSLLYSDYYQVMSFAAPNYAHCRTCFALLNITHSLLHINKRLRHEASSIACIFRSTKGHDFIISADLNSDFINQFKKMDLFYPHVRPEQISRKALVSKTNFSGIWQAQKFKCNPVCT